eukprot:CAMPEP_0117668248 /NCGR_PEP_ID=MMETSP0804-20121206/11439_1 /TAXON_ID=1074897 /ORGANISM="Tetraselmis astigmatica, Strain CCMP880" /LENGTH=373 /DNA_ID=CAMNT_0005476109 /DNA_START=88 /DNA_END=1209 /DNA_ORIENTATION=-
MVERGSGGQSYGALSREPLEDAYRVLPGEVLGTGGYSTVYRAIDRLSNQPVAVKTVRLERSDEGSPSGGRRAQAAGDQAGCSTSSSLELRELEVLATLGPHPCIVELQQAFLQGGNLHLVMEIMETDLCDLLMQREAPFEEREVMAVMRQLLLAVAHCHRLGVMHRDIKLENVFLKNRSDCSSARLGDFGLGHMKRRWGLPKGCAGSRQYMAPEVLASRYANSDPYGRPADLWSAGVVMFALLARRFPFSGRNRLELEHTIREAAYSFSGPAWHLVSREAKDLLRKLFTVDPTERISAKSALNHPWFATLKDAPTRTSLSSAVRPPLRVHSQAWKAGVRNLWAGLAGTAAAAPGRPSSAEPLQPGKLHLVAAH